MTDEKKEPTEHTPGPWARSKDDWWIYSKANGEMVVDDIATENEFDYWLIAAAPELLAASEALEAAEHAHANCEECEGEGVPELCEKCFPLFDDARIARRLAIEKARHNSFTKG